MRSVLLDVRITGATFTQSLAPDDTFRNWRGGEESNLARSLLEGTALNTRLSLAWVGDFSTRLRRNAAPHQTLAMIEVTTLLEFSMIFSFAVSKKTATESPMANPNEISTCASINAPLPKSEIKIYSMYRADLNKVDGREAVT